MDRLVTLLLGHRWVSLAVVAVLLIGYLGIAEVPRRLVELKALYDEVQQTQARIETAAGSAATLAHLARDERALEERLEALVVSLPRADQMSAVLATLQAQADSCDVTLVALRPGERLTGAVHDRLPLELMLRGRFAPLRDFVQAVETAAYLMPVRGFQLEAEGLSGSTLEARLLVEIITLKASDLSAPRTTATSP